jgi:hypothetical protein
MIFSLGPTELHRVQIDVLSYSYPAESSDRHDRNWLRADASVHVESFSAKEPLSILTWDLTRLLKELEKLHETLKGKAIFDTREDQLKLVLTGDGLGKIGLCGRIATPHPHTTTLTFGLAFDQTYLAESISQLRHVVAAFPER